MDFTKGHKHYDALQAVFTVLKAFPDELRTDDEWKLWMDKCREVSAGNEYIENLLVVVTQEKDKEFRYGKTTN